jgi:5'-3' exonuclease
MKWSSSYITPGTKFMDKLHCELTEFIKNKNDGFGNKI